MFLRNYDNLLLAQQLYYTELVKSRSGHMAIGTDTGNKGDGYLNGTTTSGSVVLFTDCYHFTSGGSSDYTIPLLAFSASSICLGNSNTPVDYDDIKLAGSVVANNLTQTSNTLTYDESTCSWKRTVVASYANTDSSAITIAEWGIFRAQDTTSIPNYNNASANCVLLYREVLEEPIVIAAGTTVELTFTLEIPMPNHP